MKEYPESSIATLKRGYYFSVWPGMVLTSGRRTPS
jgi:hypothetical protein